MVANVAHLIALSLGNGIRARIAKRRSSTSNNLSIFLALFRLEQSCGMNYRVPSVVSLLNTLKYNTGVKDLHNAQVLCFVSWGLVVYLHYYAKFQKQKDE